MSSPISAGVEMSKIIGFVVVVREFSFCFASSAFVGKAVVTFVSSAFLGIVVAAFWTLGKGLRVFGLNKDVGGISAFVFLEYLIRLSAAIFLALSSKGQLTILFGFGRFRNSSILRVALKSPKYCTTMTRCSSLTKIIFLNVELLK